MSRRRAAGAGRLADPAGAGGRRANCADTLRVGRRSRTPTSIVALGGDGFMLQTLHAMLERRKPIVPGVRDEPRHGRLPDERMAHRRPRRPARSARKPFKVIPLSMTADDRRRRDHHAARDQRGLAAARDAPDRQAGGHRQRPRRAARTGLRRHPRRHARRLDRLQSLGPGPDPAARLGRCWR